MIQQRNSVSFGTVIFFDKMATEHIKGRKNYIREINAVLTLEAIQRLLIRSSASEQSGQVESTAPTLLVTANTVTPRFAGNPRTVLAPSDLQPTMQNRGPTFVGIGSMRCGSTWLYEVLKCHPDVQMSDSKEMDFFFMPQMLQHDLDWYTAHFESTNGGQSKPVRGEISPRYARLKGWQVKRIAELLPELRIILTLRHPIERVWSQTLYDFGRLQGRDIRKVKTIEFLRQLERPRSRLSSDYHRTMRIWSEAFGRDALHIAFFDQLRGDPSSYINAILRHIGAGSPWLLPDEFINKKVFATKALVGRERDIPELVRWYLADQLLEQTEQLNQLLEGRVSSWVEEMRTIREDKVELANLEGTKSYYPFGS